MLCFLTSFWLLCAPKSWLKCLFCWFLKTFLSDFLSKNNKSLKNTVFSYSFYLINTQTLGDSLRGVPNFVFWVHFSPFCSFFTNLWHIFLKNPLKKDIIGYPPVSRPVLGCQPALTSCEKIRFSKVHLKTRPFINQSIFDHSKIRSPLYWFLSLNKSIKLYFVVELRPRRRRRKTERCLMIQI